MTVDQLVLGCVEGDETVLSYLDSLTDTALEDLFRPMFTVTRPVNSLKDRHHNPVDSRGVPSRPQRNGNPRASSGKAKLEARIEGMSPEKRKLLEGLI